MGDAMRSCSSGRELAALGHGDVTLPIRGRIGGDAFGTTILRRLRGEGVDVTWLRTDATAATGILIRERQPLGASEVIYRRTGSAGSMLGPGDVVAAAAAGLFATARWLHITGITPALSESAAAAVGANGLSAITCTPAATASRTSSRRVAGGGW